MFFLQQVAIGWLQVAHQPAIIYVNPFACLFALKDWVSFENMSIRWFAVIDKVILPVCFQHNPFIIANVMNSHLTLDKVNWTILFDIINYNPALNMTIAPDTMSCYLTPDELNFSIAPNVMMCYLTPDGVNLTITPDVMNCYLTSDGVNLTITPDMMNCCYLTPDGVNLTIASDVMFCYLNPDGVNWTIAPDAMTSCQTPDIV